MKRRIGYLALVLGCIGLAGCVSGFIAIWVARPVILRSSDELFAVMDESLQLVEQKTTQAAALVTRIRSGVAPVADQITKLADKADRTPEDGKALMRITDELSQRLDQVDALAELAESAAAFFNKTKRLGKSLRLPASRISAGELPEDGPDRLAALANVATKLRDLREKVAKIRDDQQVRRDIVDAVVGNARDVDENLKQLNSRLELVRENSIEWRLEVTELHDSVPRWTTWAAITSSMILAWMGLGQFVLVRRASELVRASQSP